MIDTATEQVVFSEPLAEITGEGKNDKYVKECIQLHLADRGIEKLKGFDRLVNLEVLFLNNNKLTHISHLDKNFRMRRLYAANNKIFTLKGSSIKTLRFLELVDLTNNNLRDLQKVLGNIEHLKFLKELELSGNPCCEEPDYRSHVIFRFPSLHVLDSHIVSEEERARAVKLLGEETVQNNIAFMQRAPPKPQRVHANYCSQLESELNTEVEKLKISQAKTHISEEQAVVNALEAMHGGAAADKITVNRVKDELKIIHYEKNPKEEDTLEAHHTAYLEELPEGSRIQLDPQMFNKFEEKKTSKGRIGVKATCLSL